MEYQINGSKITVIRKEETDGITIIDGLLNALILEIQDSKEKKLNDKEKREE